MNEKGGHKSQVDSRYEEIRRLIITCEFPPGMRLNEKALMERLGCGRTPVREALLRLDQDLLVETRQRSGYFVRSLTPKSIIDTLEAWGGVAPLIISTAMKNMSEDDRRELLTQVNKELDVGGEPIKTSRAGRSIMDKIVGFADNEPYEYFYRHLRSDLERISTLAHLTHETKWVSSLSSLSTLLQESDPEKAAAIVRDRLKESTEMMLRYFLDHSPFEMHLPYFESNGEELSAIK